ncbi:hypothetical protein M758_8G172600 [Ceratodon purpureus]|nr:hypothetical protein M758_8G172600 [Ceratodon purpureus]
MMEKKKELLVRHFDKPPSTSEFARIEDANVPAVLEGCVRGWPAYRLWNPSKGGLERLKHLAGAATVQVMATTSGANFYGDIRGHDRVPIQFQSFLDLADRSRTGAEMSNLESEFAFLESEDVQLYLAQAGIFSQESVSPSPLSALREDIETPSFLQTPVSAMNLWMSVNGSRSSTHYDPFHNLLCIVSGCKEVKLWPPSAAPSLYPLPIFGEASNHSGVDFANPDLIKYPRFRWAMENFQSVTLHAGDALFLPEGWYHQVDSEAVTIAVNLWWPSKISLKLGSHMDAYLLRRLLANLLDSEKENIIEEFRRSVSGDVEAQSDRSDMSINVQNTSDARKSVTDVVEKSCVTADAEPAKCREFIEGSGATVNVQNAEGNHTGSNKKLKKKSKRDRRRSKVRVVKGAEDSLRSTETDDMREVLVADASPSITQSESAVQDVGSDMPTSSAQKYGSTSLRNAETQALRTLVLCVSDMMMSTSDDTHEDPFQEQSQVSGLDTIARVFSSLDPPSLQRTLLVMSIDYPKTLEALILHKLSPLASEILTRKFEEMDADSGLDLPQEEFYAQIYRVFDDPGLAMAALVDGKESLAAMALQRVLDGNLGLSCTLPGQAAGHL